MDYPFLCKYEDHHEELGFLCKKTNKPCIQFFAIDNGGFEFRKKLYEHCPGGRKYPKYKKKKTNFNKGEKS